MFFKYHIGPEGPTDARVAVVCEKPAADEVSQGRLLVGASGQRVRNHLYKAGVHAGDARVLSKEVFLTNAVQNFDDPRANPTPSDVARELPRLYRELCSLPNLTTIIGMGACALQALSGFEFNDITNRRGSRLLTPFGIKYIPTFHPSYYMRGEWRYQPIVQFDVNRAIKESQWKQIKKTQRYWNIRPSFQEASTWIKHLLTTNSPYLSFDIETIQGRNGTWYVSCIAFSTVPTEAYCIPLMRRDRKPYWPEISTECSIWRGIAQLLSQPNRIYITQNGAAFDTWQLRKHGIITPYMASGFDTFSAHSLLAPDLPHDLGFLVSIYTDEEYYKSESGRGQAGFGNVAEDKFWIYNCKDAALTLEVALGQMEDMKEIL